jgi:hypothetical protein
MNLPSEILWARSLQRMLWHKRILDKARQERIPRQAFGLSPEALANIDWQQVQILQNRKDWPESYF